MKIANDIMPTRPKRILVINYGMGNIRSVCNALESLGGRFVVSDRKTDIADADAYILPGVGAFAAAMDNLRALDLVEALTEAVVQRKKPYLGICLGMQLLARDSVEMGFSTGLGWIDGHVAKLDPSGGLSVPHVGWNDVRVVAAKPLFDRLDRAGHFYFDHSFHLQCADDLITAVCDYGGPVVAAIRKENILATQFHPEKSQRNGLKLLRGFLHFVAAN